MTRLCRLERANVRQRLSRKSVIQFLTQTVLCLCQTLTRCTSTHVSRTYLEGILVFYLPFTRESMAMRLKGNGVAETKTKMFRFHTKRLILTYSSDSGSAVHWRRGASADRVEEECHFRG